jgi:NAD(P)-dependent dehydrogenase (short-subunit alcohol dehydrogenase family)
VTGGKGVAFITGASGGLGNAIARRFHEAGWQLALGYHQHPCEGDLTFRFDVRDEAAVARAMDATAEKLGRIDVLVNAAGVVADHTLGKLEQSEWDAVLDTHLKGAFLCSRAALRHMVRQRSGHIITIGSWAARFGNFGQANYAAAKGGLIGLTQSLAREYGKRGIQVNCVLPGFMKTALTAPLAGERVAQILADNVLGSASEPDDAARFILFLTTLKNVSGQIFQLDSRIAPWT